VAYRMTHEDDGAARPATLCRLSTERGRWRVKVQAWDGREGWRGRLLFEPESGEDVREGPVALRGQSREDLLAAAHEISERRLRELLNSLG
jgi:hypothetical protein